MSHQRVANVQLAGGASLKAPLTPRLWWPVHKIEADIRQKK
jgi:hypothetical protein